MKKTTTSAQHTQHDAHCAAHDAHCTHHDGRLMAAPTEFIPPHPSSPEVAYKMVKDETYPQTQPRLNLATFVTTYMDEYATKLMNEAVNINYIDETEYPRVAVMCGRCINIIANLWNTPEKAEWKAGALGIGSSEACRTIPLVL